ncbi:MAG: hypothetical protein HY255_06095 [Betaproteobacteria bacterium]|nr:hypothetical protein [Betaproteobacteria bacterium]
MSAQPDTAIREVDLVEAWNTQDPKYIDGGKLTVSDVRISPKEYDLTNKGISLIILVNCTIAGPTVIRVQENTLVQIESTNLPVGIEDPGKTCTLTVDPAGQRIGLLLKGTCLTSLLFKTGAYAGVTVTGMFARITFENDCTFSGDVKYENVFAVGIVHSRNHFNADFSFGKSGSPVVDLHECRFHFGFEIYKANLPSKTELVAPSPRLHLDGAFITSHKDGLIRESAFDVISLTRLTIGVQRSLSLESVDSKMIDWSRIVFLDSAKLSFRDTSLSNSFLAGTRLDQVEIGVGCWERGPRLWLDGRLPLKKADMYEWTPSFFELGVSFGARKALSKDFTYSLALNLESYRQLLKYYEERRDFPMAEAFHYGEMEMMRWTDAWHRSVPDWIGRNLSLLNFYRLTSGYGTSVSQAACVLVLALLGATVLFLLAGLKCSQPDIANCSVIQYAIWPTTPVDPAKWFADLSSAFVYTLEAASLQKDAKFAPLNDWGRLVRALLPPVVAGQIALVIFALRRRLRRATSI